MNTQNISPADEREAREWLAKAIVYDGGKFPTIQADKHRATILALLDRPVMPAPAELPWAVLSKMRETLRERMNFIMDRETARALYAVGYDHYNPPPAPVKVEAWGIAGDNGEIVATYRSRVSAEKRLPICANGCRIVHLREVEADQ